MKKIIALLLTLGLWFSYANAETKMTRLYKGEPLGTEKVAILRVSRHNINSATFIKKVDDKYIGQGRGSYEILPGEHTVIVGFEDRLRQVEAREDATIKFTAAPNHEYGIVTNDTGTKGMTWSAGIRDETGINRMNMEYFENLARKAKDDAAARKYGNQNNRQLVVTPIENEIYAEYVRAVNGVILDTDSKEQKLKKRDGVVTEICNKYLITKETLQYLIEKVAHKKAPPQSYVPPRRYE
jgi:hypothetical protein